MSISEHGRRITPRSHFNFIFIRGRIIIASYPDCANFSIFARERENCRISHHLTLVSQDTNSVRLDCFAFCINRPIGHDTKFRINTTRSETLLASRIRIAFCIFGHAGLSLDILDVARIKRRIGNHEGREMCGYTENENDTAAREVNNAGLKIRRFHNM